MQDFEEAIERVIAGPERKSRVINQREKEMTAYHEAGHALVAWHLPHADRVHKISIVSRGNMGGHTYIAARGGPLPLDQEPVPGHARGHDGRPGR